MKNKNTGNITRTIPLILPLVALDTIFFLLMKGQKSVNAWLSFSFGNFSYLCFLGTIIFDVKTKNSLKLRLNIKILGMIYFAFNFMTALVYLILESAFNKYSGLFSTKLTVATYIFYLFCFIMFSILDFVLSLVEVEE